LHFYLLSNAKKFRKKFAFYFIRKQNVTSYLENIRYITVTDTLLRNILIPRKDEKKLLDIK
jgi:hypothetical protein